MYHFRLKLDESQDFIEKHHRHSKPLKRHMWSIGAVKHLSDNWYYEPHVLGVCTVDRCSSAWSKRRDHLEIRRLCVRDDAPKNTCSFLIGQATRGAAALGYDCVVTYTKPHENGSSLLSAGWWIQRATGTGLLQWVWARNFRRSTKHLKFTKDVLSRPKDLSVSEGLQPTN